MSWADTSRDVVNSLILELSDRSLSQLEHDHLENIYLARDQLYALLNDPPGLGTEEGVDFGWASYLPLFWAASRGNCLYWMDSPTVGRMVNLLPVCRSYLDELEALLRQIAQTGRQFIDAPTMLCEAVDAQADAVTNAVAAAQNVAGTDQDGAWLVEYPLGFGNSCEPKFPLWLGLGVAVWVGSKLLR